MAYIAPTFVNNNTPALNETNMNKLVKAVELLGVENGGTGKTSVTEGAILVGDGTEALDELIGSGAVYATSSGNPQMGTLPVSCGGTGATTIDQFKENLGLTKAGFVISDSAPSNTNVLWINSLNNTMNYYNGTGWISIVGVYGV